MEIVWLVLGLVLGGASVGAAAYVIVDRRTRSAIATARTEATLAAAQADQARQSLTDVTHTAAGLRLQLATEQQTRATLAAKLESEAENLRRQTDATAEAVKAFTGLRDRAEALQQERSAMLATLDAEKKALVEQRERFGEQDKRLREGFAELSAAALKANREEFLVVAEQRFKTLQTEAAGAFDQKKAEMGQLIQPMRQTLEEYRTKLDAIEQTRASAYVDIKENLAAVAATQQHLSVETKQLVTALRRPQGRGRWGELTLRRLFEMAGLADRVTFAEQVSTDDGRQRPDCIVMLPQDRQVIVDSKCVLDAFLSAAECTDDVQRQACVVRHAEQVRSRVRELSSKAYWESFGHATDYVVLFLPGEAFLYAAVDVDPTLIEDALNQRVIVASPTTLLGLLRVIEHGWRHKAIEDNAQEIKELGGKLYARVAKVAEHLDKLGRAISGVTGAYNDAIGSMEKNVLSAAREMAKLGVPTKNAPVAAIEDLSDETRSLRASAWKSLEAAS